MAAERKRLKAEIERVLKKVQEGQELFNDLWSQVHESENSNQRDKLEGELKKEMKKLQRLREQMKPWITAGDVKDKQPIWDARKSIEKDMERFRVWEKEAKTKGYGNADKDKDPKQRARDEAKDWINSTIDSLQEKVGQFETETEELQSNLKKKQKPPSRLAELEVLMDNFSDHVKKLEKIQRCIDNETIQPDQLQELKSELENFLEEDGEIDEMGAPSVDDFYLTFQDQLEAVDQAAAAAAGGVHTKLTKERDRAAAAAAAAAAARPLSQQNSLGGGAVKSEEEDVERKGSGKLPSIKASASTSPTAGGGMPLPLSSSSTTGGTTPSNASSSSSPAATWASSVATLGAAPNGGGAATTSSGGGATAMTSSSTGAYSLTPGSSADASSSSTESSAADPSSSSATAAASTSCAPAAIDQFIGDFKALNVQSGGAGSAVTVGSGSSTIVSETANDPAAPAASSGVVSGPNASAGSTGDVPDSSAQGPAVQSGTAQGAGGDVSTSVMVGGGGVPAAAQAVTQVQAAAVQAQSQAQAQVKSSPVTMSDFQLPSVAQTCNFQVAKNILEACCARAMPQPSDLEWRHYRPRHPVPTPSSFPRAVPSLMDDPLLFSRIDAEALFFAFYFQPGTYQQYLAAQALKRQNWRFHKQHNAWFQRSDNPTEINDEYELGSYVYFDYNLVQDSRHGWCYRRQENFPFRYDALEDELPVAKAPTIQLQ